MWNLNAGCLSRAREIGQLVTILSSWEIESFPKTHQLYRLRPWRRLNMSATHESANFSYPFFLFSFAPPSPSDMSDQKIASTTNNYSSLALNSLGIVSNLSCLYVVHYWYANPFALGFGGQFQVLSFKLNSRLIVYSLWQLSSYMLISTLLLLAWLGRRLPWGSMCIESFDQAVW
jgi:hypothetical protein